MAIQITISPPAAADAGCTAESAVAETGSYPMPGADVGNATVSGSYTRYSYSATPSAGWVFLHFAVTYEDYYKEVDGSGHTREETREYAVDAPEGSRAWTWDDVVTRSSNPYVEDSLHWELRTEGGDLLVTTDDTRTIKSVVAVFARALPHGPILCNHSGVLVCNQSGDLLWH